MEEKLWICFHLWRTRFERIGWVNDLNDLYSTQKYTFFVAILRNYAT